MAISTASGPWRSNAGFIVPITYVFASDIVGGTYQIKDAGARILILSAADGGPAAPVDFILPEVTLAPGKTVWSPAAARPEFNGIEGSITNYGLVGHMLLGYSGQPVSGNPAGVTIAAGEVVQWGGNGNPNAPWLAISTAILVA